MCGIAGIINLDSSKVNFEKFSLFLDELEHRGPDSKGVQYFENESIALGHRRLSILDLSENGSQPMFDKEKEFAIILNGEIYNFLELRSELIKEGYIFYSDTDTEIVLYSYKHWGIECLNKFNGMWAFALYDIKNNELILSRDRFGVKPLYYTHSSNGYFAFSSETKAFSKLDKFDKKINHEVVKFAINNPYFIEGNGYTIFEEIYQLLPGHYLKIKNKIPDTYQIRWYDIRDKIKVYKGNTDEASSKLKELFFDACKIRLRADVPIASALSGGLDSSSVYCSINEILNSNLKVERTNENNRKAITVSFPDSELDEIEYAEIIAKKYGKENWVIAQNFENNLSEEIIHDTKHFDALSPKAINSIFKIYEAVKNEKIVISLDGHGVDEMMFGYRYTLEELFCHYVATGKKQKAEKIKDILINLFHNDSKKSSKERYEKALKHLNSNFNRIKSFIKNFNKNHLTNYQKIEKPKLKKLTLSNYDFSNFTFEKRLLLEDFFIYSLPTFMRDFDRASMAHHIEVRMPFMDYRLVEFVFSLPIDYLLNENKTKYILRKSMNKIVPDKILNRTFKIGIQAPMENWFYNGFYKKSNEFLENNEFQNLYKSFYNSDFDKLKEEFKNKTLNNNELDKLWNIINLYIISK